MTCVCDMVVAQVQAQGDRMTWTVCDPRMPGWPGVVITVKEGEPELPWAPGDKLRVTLAKVEEKP